MKKFVLVVTVFMVFFACVYISEHNEKEYFNWFLEPLELIGTEEYHLAHMYVPEEYEVIYIRDNDEWKSFDWLEDVNTNQKLWDYAKENPGVLRFFNWNWNSSELKEKYLPIYGEGLWAIKSTEN